MVRHESTPDRQQKEEVQAGELVHEEIKDFAAYVLSLSTPQDVSQEVKDELINRLHALDPVPS